MARRNWWGLADGIRESAQSWKELLLDLKRRGLTIDPQLAVADGALGAACACNRSEYDKGAASEASSCSLQSTAERAGDRD
jgi:transposase-like protein